MVEGRLGPPAHRQRADIMPPVTDTVGDSRAANLQRMGRPLIVAGILVWGVWVIVKLTGGDPQLEYFLPFHLLGVIPGSILSRWATVKRWIGK